MMTVEKLTERKGVGCGSPQSEAKRPVHTVKLGPVIAAIWENKTEYGPRYSVTLEQLYKDDSDKWNSSHSVFAANLPLAEKVLSKAFDYIECLEEGRN